MQACPSTPHPRPNEQGFLLIGLLVAIFIILLVLGVAAPRLAKSLRRDRELEAVHRGQQYTRAIQLYYRKLGHYPGSLDQLEKTNNIRFLRQRYPDPLAQPVDGKADWRLIHVGEAKTTVKGFFGQPLAGLANATGNLGSLAGSVSSGRGGATGANTSGAVSSGSSSTFGTSSFGTSSSTSSTTGSSSAGSAFGGSSFNSNTGNNSATSPSSSATGSQAAPQTGSSFGSAAGTGASSSSGLSSQSATSFSGGGAPIVGVGSNAPGSSIIVLNEQITYPTWEFLYDPRVEQLKAKAAMLNGASSSGSGSGFGTSATSFGGSNPSNNSNGTAQPGVAPTTPNNTPPSPAPGTPTTPPQ